MEFPRAGVFLIGTQNRSLIGPLYFSLIGRFTAVIGVFDWPISAGFNWTTKEHNNREKQQKNRRKWRVIKTNKKQQTHTEGKGKMSQNKKVRKNSATESKKKKSANSAKESKRKTPQTREQNDRRQRKSTRKGEKQERKHEKREREIENNEFSMQS